MCGGGYVEISSVIEAIRSIAEQPKQLSLTVLIKADRTRNTQIASGTEEQKLVSKGTLIKTNNFNEESQLNKARLPKAIDLDCFFGRTIYRHATDGRSL